MGNFTGEVKLATAIISEDSLEEGLKTLLSIDSDYDEVQNEVVTEIVEENCSVEDMIDALLEYNGHEDIPAFVVGNDSCCSSFKVSVDEIEPGLFYVAVAYGI